MFSFNPVMVDSYVFNYTTRDQVSDSMAVETKTFHSRIDAWYHIFVRDLRGSAIVLALAAGGVGLFGDVWVLGFINKLSEDTQEKPHSRSTAFPRHQKKERREANKNK